MIVETGSLFGTIAAQLRESTVQVRSHHGGGSGVVWADDGLIVTNAHVVARRQVQVEFLGGGAFDAEIEAVDTSLDLAALRVQGARMRAAMIGDSGSLRVGQPVIAIGNPLGQTGAASAGIIQAIHPEQRWVRADLRLLPGNSGGPLADSNGAVIGVNSMVAGGLGLAVPSHAVQAFLGTKRRLGIAVQPVRFAAGVGLLVSEVEPNSVAEQIGLMLGDIIVGSDGTGFDRMSDVRSQLGIALVLSVSRGGHGVTVVLGSEAGRAAA